MSTYNYILRIWTGASLVRELSNRLREAGVEIIREGMEQIHIRAEGNSQASACHNVWMALIKTNKTSLGTNNILYNTIQFADVLGCENVNQGA